MLVLACTSFARGAETDQLPDRLRVGVVRMAGGEEWLEAMTRMPGDR